MAFNPVPGDGCNASSRSRLEQVAVQRSNGLSSRNFTPAVKWSFCKHFESAPSPCIASDSAENDVFVVRPKSFFVTRVRKTVGRPTCGGFAKGDGGVRQVSST